MTTLIATNDLLVKNRFLGAVQSSWQKEFKLAHLLPKDHAPIEIVFPRQDQIFFDKAHLGSNQRKKFPTNYIIRLTGLGYRRIYIGFAVLGYKWEPTLNRFCKSGYESRYGGSYFFIEVKGQPIVLIVDLANA